MKEINDYYRYKDTIIVKWNKKIPVTKRGHFPTVGLTFIKSQPSILGRTYHMTLTDDFKPITEEDAMMELL